MVTFILVLNFYFNAWFKSTLTVICLFYSSKLLQLFLLSQLWRLHTKWRRRNMQMSSRLWRYYLPKWYLTFFSIVFFVVYSFSARNVVFNEILFLSVSWSKNYLFSFEFVLKSLFNVHFVASNILPRWRTKRHVRISSQLHGGLWDIW